MVLIKNKKQRFWRKKNNEHFYGSWSLKGEKIQRREVSAVKIISLESFRILTFCSLKTCLQFFFKLSVRISS